MNFIHEQNCGPASFLPGFIYGRPNVLDSSSDSGKVYEVSVALLRYQPGQRGFTATWRSPKD